MMSSLPLWLEFRPITEEDQDFLYHVYRSTRINEPGLGNWPEEEREAFLQQQFGLQHHHYLHNYLNPAFNIILLDKEPVGRLYLERDGKEIRVVDIALLPEYRGKGIGKEIFNNLIKESEQQGLPLTLHVEYYNPVQEWYQRLGFQPGGNTGIYIFMKRNPGKV